MRLAVGRHDLVPALAQQRDQVPPDEAARPEDQNAHGSGPHERGQALEVGPHHPLDQLLERHLRLPAQHPPGLGRVADQQVDFGRAE